MKLPSTYEFGGRGGGAMTGAAWLLSAPCLGRITTLMPVSSDGRRFG